MSKDYFKYFIPRYILQLAIADMIFLITAVVRIDYAMNKKPLQINGCRFINTTFYVNYHSSILFITVRISLCDLVNKVSSPLIAGLAE